MTDQSRAASHTAVASALGELSDDQLRRLLASATPFAAGIGGGAALLTVASNKVFVKRLPISRVEQQPQLVGSTANIFKLPTHCHYGVGAPSTSAWRELSVHQITTTWVLDGSCDAFPVLHHWRVLENDQPGALNCAEHGDIETWIAFWHGSDAVRQRLEALAEASDDLVLFLEYLPRNLLTCLEESLSAGVDALDATLDRVEAQLLDVARFMAANGLWHFDAHMRNILVDNERLYVSDFGLASSSTFDHTANEARFLNLHLEHDIAYVVTQLVNWIAVRLSEASRSWKSPRERNTYIRRWAAGPVSSELTPGAARLLGRYSPVAAVMNDFYYDLHSLSRLTPYPVAAVHEACVVSGIAIDQPGG